MGDGTICAAENTIEELIKESLTGLNQTNDCQSQWQAIIVKRNKKMKVLIKLIFILYMKTGKKLTVKTV